MSKAWHNYMRTCADRWHAMSDGERAKFAPASARRSRAASPALSKRSRSRSRGRATRTKGKGEEDDEDEDDDNDNNDDDTDVDNVQSVAQATAASVKADQALAAIYGDGEIVTKFLNAKWKDLRDTMALNGWPVMVQDAVVYVYRKIRSFELSPSSETWQFVLQQASRNPNNATDWVYIVNKIMTLDTNNKFLKTMPPMVPVLQKVLNGQLPTDFATVNRNDRLKLQISGLYGVYLMSEMGRGLPFG
jgi:hypothetical protein